MTSHSRTILIHNPSSDAVLVKRFATNCSTRIRTPVPLRIPGHHTTAIEVEFDLTSLRVSETRDTSQRVQFIVTPVTQCEIGEQSLSPWIVKGILRTAFRVEPPAIRMGSVSELRQRQARCLPVRVVPTIALERLHVSSDSESISASLIAVPDLSSFDLAVKTIGERPPGTYTSRVVLHGTTPDGKQMRRAIPVKLTILTDVQPEPRRLLLPATVNGGSVRDSVRLHSLAGRRFDVIRFETTSRDLQVCPRSSAGDRRTGPSFTITCAMRDPGEHNETIVFHVLLDNGMQLRVPVEVLYHVPNGIVPQGFLTTRGAK